MSNVLDNIIAYKREEVRERQKRLPWKQVKRAADCHAFHLGEIVRVEAPDGFRPLLRQRAGVAP